MSVIRILHAADLHLDSPFEGLGPDKAACRRAEQRALLGRLTEVQKREGAQLVLLSGDLLDTGSAYRETAEELLRALGAMGAPVFIAPGNHDYYSPRSPYALLRWPENVHIFTAPRLECVPVPGLSARVWGAAFTDSRSAPLLAGFGAEKTAGVIDLLCLHGEVGARESVYDPIGEDELARSGMDYAALGHIHRESGLKRAGDTYYAWPGCPEGRGFDETGEKYVYLADVGEGSCRLTKEKISQRRYEILKTDRTAPEALLAALPAGSENDIYRIILTGETDEAPDLDALFRALEGRFFALQLRDETRLRRDVWENAGDDTLRGIFLRALKTRRDAAADPAERELCEQAARWGLAALDNREEVRRHGDP